MRNVLAIKKTSLVNLLGSLPLSNQRKLYLMDLPSLIKEEDLVIVDRNEVDDPNKVELGAVSPQLLPYVVITYKGKLLTYSREKGTEARLHGTRSIGFGGHMDTNEIPEDIVGFFLEDAKREVLEETGISVDELEFTGVIVDYSNDVGKVHLGVTARVSLTDEQYDSLNVDETEISDPKWLPLVDVHKEREGYENWSQVLLENV